MAANAPLLRALEEWRQARQAIFDRTDPPIALWGRLADAEHALMAIANRLKGT